MAYTGLVRSQRGNETRTLAGAQRELDDGVIRAVVLGDSVAHGAGDETGRGIGGWLDQAFQATARSAAPARNLGIDGARTFNVRALLRQPAARDAIRRADLIVISLGGNDLYGDSRARLLSTIWPLGQREKVLTQLEHVVEGVRRLNPAGRIVLLGLYNPYRHGPARVWIDRQVNLWDGGLITRLASERAVTVVRISDLLSRDDRISPLDRFHPGAAGYAAIARRIAETL